MTPEEAVNGAIIWLSRRKEFYGHIFQRFHKIPFDGVFKSGTFEVTTAGVLQEGQSISFVYNRDFIRELVRGKTIDKVIGLVEHEVLHVCLGHLQVDLPDSIRTEFAADCSVNSFIAPEYLHESAVLPERFGLPDRKSIGWYYDNLPNSDQFAEDQESISGSHSGWSSISGHSVDFLIQTSGRACRNFDGIQDQVIEYIGALTDRNTSIPWDVVLRGFPASLGDSVIEWTGSRESRRFETRPGIRKRDLSDIAVIVDTSASISASDAKKFFSEIYWIYRNTDINISIIEADCDVRRCYPYRGKFLGEISGRGNTDLTPAIQEAMKRKFDGIIYFTDFFAPKINMKLNVPILWALVPGYNKDAPSEYGKRIVLAS